MLVCSAIGQFSGVTCCVNYYANLKNGIRQAGRIFNKIRIKFGHISW